MLKKIIIITLIFVALSACSTTQDNESENRYHPKAAARFNMQLGIAYLQAGKNERAKSKLLTALAQDPNSAAINNAMAYFLEKTGQPNLSEEYYKHALRIAPSEGAALNNYGAFLCRHKRYAEAEKHFLKAVKDGAYIQAAEAYENAGLCALENKQEMFAEKYFIKALERDPTRVNALIELADLSYQHKDYEKAHKYLERYNEQQSDNARSSSLSLRVAKKLGLHKEEAKYASLLKKNFTKSKLRNEGRNS